MPRDFPSPRRSILRSNSAYRLCGHSISQWNIAIASHTLGIRNVGMFVAPSALSRAPCLLERADLPALMARDFSRHRFQRSCSFGAGASSHNDRSQAAWKRFLICVVLEMPKPGDRWWAGDRRWRISRVDFGRIVMLRYRLGRCALLTAFASDLSESIRSASE